MAKSEPGAANAIISILACRFSDRPFSYSAAQTSAGAVKKKLSVDIALAFGPEFAALSCPAVQVESLLAAAVGLELSAKADCSQAAYPVAGAPSDSDFLEKLGDSP